MGWRVTTLRRTRSLTGAIRGFLNTNGGGRKRCPPRFRGLVWGVAEEDLLPRASPTSRAEDELYRELEDEYADGDEYESNDEPPTTTLEQEAPDAAKHMHPVAHRARQLPLATPGAVDGFATAAGGDVVWRSRARLKDEMLAPLYLWLRAYKVLGPTPASFLLHRSPFSLPPSPSPFSLLLSCTFLPSFTPLLTLSSTSLPLPISSSPRAFVAPYVCLRSASSTPMGRVAPSPPRARAQTDTKGRGDLGLFHGPFVRRSYMPWGRIRVGCGDVCRGDAVGWDASDATAPNSRAGLGKCLRCDSRRFLPTSSAVAVVRKPPADPGPTQSRAQALLFPEAGETERGLLACLRILIPSHFSFPSRFPLPSPFENRLVSSLFILFFYSHVHTYIRLHRAWGGFVWALAMGVPALTHACTCANGMYPSALRRALVHPSSSNSNSSASSYAAPSLLDTSASTSTSPASPPGLEQAQAQTQTQNTTATVPHHETNATATRN
ncbi:hypothetical protein C8F04DRAFT_1299283 [Mycena alexandri]|uniref:Uncharacterized protein n=1 Tax=Mycena alexandri TaxID=1745969 RepID=A0AAD6XDZ5_9AGAR|nr:hypothetical protein C8F04DRAFT_1299283 [Mycena alexandri]